jgi:hypothetical protein
MYRLTVYDGTLPFIVDDDDQDVIVALFEMFSHLDPMIEMTIYDRVLDRYLP